MSDLDDQLRACIEAVRQHPPNTLERRIVLNMLLRKIQTLPDLLKSTHQDYEEALNLTWQWVCQNIDRFEAGEDSVATRLRIWINGYLRWRIYDLYSPDSKYTTLAGDRLKVRVRSLDQPSSSEEKTSTLANQLSDPKWQRGNGYLDTIDRQIEEAQTQDRQRLGQVVMNYVEQDPDQRLRQCHMRDSPHIHAQLLALRLYLREPPDTIADLSREFGVNYQALTSHWKRKCKPLLKQIIEELSQTL